MKFTVTAKQTVQIEREVEIRVTKRDVVEAGYCKSVEDGDPSGWYEYVVEYVRDHGGTSSFSGATDTVVIDEELIDICNETGWDAAA